MSFDMYNSNKCKTTAYAILHSIRCHPERMSCHRTLLKGQRYRVTIFVSFQTPSLSSFLQVNVAECQRVTERFAAVYLPGKEEYQEFVMSDCDGKA